ncbi:MAG: endopeptidase La, partial [Deltaproteobacteria bacterium]|nr:endopeptidase La [Deltaproteobacteria bacterium]
ITQSEPYFSCDVEVLAEEDAPGTQTDALVQSVHNVFEDYVKMNKKVAPEMANSVASIDEPSRLADTVIAHLSLDLEEKQRLLELISPAARLEEVHRLMQSEMEVLEVERKIRGRVKKQMERSQKEYYLNEQMRAIQKELGERDEFKNEITELEDKLDAKEMPESVRERSCKELRKLKMMSPMSAEATVVRNYIDWVLALPWDHESEDMRDVGQAEIILDEDHFGLEKPKERILEYLAVQQLVDRMKGPILCFVGPPGVGKTSLGKSVSRATGREFVRISLGGVRDEAEIRGHRRTYIGAMPGKILQSLKRAGTSNPVFLLDEIDKMASDFRGDPSSALLEVLDPEQNSTFNDHYMDMDYDLSKVMFICTANVLHEIPVPLLDRMEVIQIPGYIESEKLNIAQSYLVSKQLEQNGLSEDQIEFTKGGLMDIIRHYTREAGVRGLEREIASVCRKVAREFVSDSDDFKKVRVTPTVVHKLLGVQKFRHGRVQEEDRVGVCTGLAFTQVGGELLETEVAVTVGQGKLKVTGRLGEVMQESANAALTYIRSRAKQLGLKQDFYSTLDIHLHVPEGGIPKDGPSAGITIATTLASAITRVPVRSNVAMTGEITLQGRVLPIGGLKEKLIAAHRGGIEKVLIPKENERDLKDVPASILRKLEIVPVEHMDQVLVEALALEDPESFLREGAHELGDIYEVGQSVGGAKSSTTEVPHPAGVN